MASNDGNQLRNLIFQDLTSKVKHLDTLCSTLKKMQKGEIQLEPSITLNRILEEVKVAEVSYAFSSCKGLGFKIYSKQGCGCNIFTVFNSSKLIFIKMSFDKLIKEEAS